MLLTCFEVLPNGVWHIPFHFLAGHTLEAGVPVEGVKMSQDGVATVRTHPTPSHTAGIVAVFTHRANEQVVCFRVWGWAFGLEERHTSGFTSGLTSSLAAHAGPGVT